MRFAAKGFFCDVKYNISQITFVRTNNVFYSSGAVACYEVGIKRDHRHSAVLSLRINVINVIHVVIVFPSILKRFLNNKNVL